MMNEVECPSVETLTDLLFGRLDGPDVDRQESHFANCDRCLERAAGLIPDDTLVAALAGEDTVSDVSKDERFRLLQNDLLSLYRDRREQLDAEADNETLVGPIPVGVPDRVAALLSPSDADGELGRLGSFRIFEILGKGGMGLVFRAVDERLQRPVALKVMHPDVADDLTARERFLREARAAAAVENDHVVTIYQVGEENDVPFIAMQLLHGESLGDRLKRIARLPVDEALRITREAALGLSAAHSRGLLHRDMKPDNIWLEEGTDRVKILDFGLARAVESDGELTANGTVVGTLNYISPEQVEGAPLDERCDLFSMGSVLYRMLSGRIPFRRSTMMATLHATVTDRQKDLSSLDLGIPQRVVALVDRMLEKQPEKRYASADELCAEIARLEHQPDIRESQQTLKNGQPDVRRAPTAKILVAVAAVVVMLLSAVIYVATDRGTLVVKADDTFTTTTKGQQITIRDKNSNRVFHVSVGKVRLRSGEYLIRVEDNEGLSLLTREFSITRGGVTNLVVSLKPPGDSDGRRNSPIPGERISPLALVSHPAKLKGLRSWTVETAWHRGEVYDLAASPDGKLLATAGVDGSVRIWTMEPFALKQILLQHSDQVRSVAWSTDGKLVASGGLDGRVILWDIAASRAVEQLPIGRRVNQLGWSRDGAVLAFRTIDEESKDSVQLWARPEGVGQHVQQQEFKNVNHYSWRDEEGAIALKPSDQNKLEIRRITDGRLVSEEQYVSNLSPDRTMRASVNKNTVQLLNAETEEAIVSLPEEKGYLVTRSWSPDSSRFVTVYSDQQSKKEYMQIFEATNGQLIRKYEHDFSFLGQHHASRARLRWTNEGKRILLWQEGAARSQLLIADVDSDRLERVALNYHRQSRSGIHGSSIRAYAWKPDGTELAIQSHTRHENVAILDAATGRRRNRIDAGGVGQLVWPSVGETLYLVSQGDSVSPGVSAVDIDRSSSDRWELGARFQPDMYWTSTSGDGRLHAFARGRKIRIVRLPEDQVVQEFELVTYQEQGLPQTRLSSDGRRLATYGTDIKGNRRRAIHIWDAQAGKLLHRLGDFDESVAFVNWSHRGEMIAAMFRGANPTIRVWNSTTGEPVKSLADPADPLYSFSWIPGQQKVAIVTTSGQCKIWDVGSEKFELSFEVHPAGCSNPNISPDGKTFLFPTAYGTVQVHSAEKGQQLGTFFSFPGGPLVHVAASGHFRVIGTIHYSKGADFVDKHLRYLVEEKDGGQRQLDRVEMSREFGWENDVAKIKLTP